MVLGITGGAKQFDMIDFPPVGTGDAVAGQRLANLPREVRQLFDLCQAKREEKRVSGILGIIETMGTLGWIENLLRFCSNCLRLRF